MRNPALSYKHPVDFDNSANEISLQVVLQDLTPKVLGSCTLSGAWSQDATSKLSRTGTGHLSRTLALEHYADGLGHDKITLISPNSLDQNSPADQSTHLSHLKQSTLCLNDLAEMVENCPFLDQDYILLALRLLQEGCSKFERSNSTKNHRGYYLEPGTVLRCDGRYDDLSRGEKSVLFCSAPYLKLDRQCDTERKPESGEARIHHIRTLLESLYDYDLMEERDNKQVIRKTAPELQDIICVPQTYLSLVVQLHWKNFMGTPFNKGQDQIA
ncbi:hypothetical protein F4779DRAFT_514788 [Xylariaceae sp. FL0662B]|nr:hypothetical protein F4779DRAFT_514788 [Xylariaceae sp. FL0662B]